MRQRYGIAVERLNLENLIVQAVLLCDLLWEGADILDNIRLVLPLSRRLPNP